LNHLIYATAQEHVADLHREADKQRTAALVRPTRDGGRRRGSRLVRHYRIAVAAVVLVVAAVFATTAYAGPISNAGPYRDTSVPPPPATVTPTSSQVRVVSTGADSRFDWGDAGIGAGAAFAITAMAGGGLLLVSNRRNKRAATVA
jgi:hypothetical protein